MPSVRPTCVDGVPEYQFINENDDPYADVLPESDLYQPVVLSQERYEELNPRPGHLVVTVQCPNVTTTDGIDASDLEIDEAIYYDAKIPINPGRFNYPIREVYIDIVGFVDVLFTQREYDLASHLEVNSTYYTLEDGTLYFTAPLEEIIMEQFPAFARRIDLYNLNSKTNYKVHILFDRFIPDTSDETHGLALQQATRHALMDYFNLYTYAQTTAHMIGEITYTEIVTLESTAQCALVTFVGAAVSGGVEAIAGKLKEFAKISAMMLLKTFAKGALQGATKSLLALPFAPIKEMFEEIITDGFLEAITEGFTDLYAGDNQEIAFWASTLLTSYRETIIGAMGRAITGSGKKDIEIDNKEYIAYYKKQAENDQDAALKIKKQIQDTIVLQKQQYAQELENRKAWKMALKSDLFKGALMLLPSIFTGGIGLFGFGKMFKGVLDLPGISAVALANHRTRQQALRKIEGDPSLSVESVFLNNLETQMKTPADLDGQDLNALFKGLEEVPITIQFPEVNIDIATEINLEPTRLTSEFNAIRTVSFASELGIKKTETVVKLMEDIRYNRGEMAAGKMLTDSMFPLIPPGFRISIDHNIPEGGIEIGDIAAYEKDGKIISHRIEYKYSQGGKIYYVMEGINKETNPMVDESPISEDLVIGKVIDISLEVMILMDYLTDRGIIPQYDVLGIPSERSIFERTGFDPLGSNLKYPINDNDSEASKLLKTIMNIIYKFESEIVKCHREIGNPLDLEFAESENKFTRANQKSELTQIATLLGIKYNTIYANWLTKFKKSLTTKITYGMRSTSLLINMWQSLSFTLNYPQIKDIYNLFNTIFKQYALTRFNPNELTIVEIRLKFSEFGYPLSGSPGDYFTQSDIGEILGKNHKYIGKFTNVGANEQYQKFFDFLNRLLFITPNHLNLYEGKNIEDLKQYCIDKVFSLMVDKGMISSEDFKEQFIIILEVLHVLTVALRRDPSNEDMDILFKYTDLNREASKQRYRSLLSEQFRRDLDSGKLKRPQIRRLIHLLRSSDYFYFAEEEISNILNNLADFSKTTHGQYHRYFKTNLLIPQTAELLKLTLGLDVNELQFIDDAKRSPTTGNYLIDLERAHLDIQKKYYQIFEIFNNKDFQGAFTEKSFAIRLAPLIKTSHLSMDHSSNSYFKTQIAILRMMHLYKILQIEYQEGTDFQSKISKIFKEKAVVINEDEISLWYGMEDIEIEEWIERWIFTKTHPLERDSQNFAEDNFLRRYYENWYINKYLPKMNDFETYLAHGKANKPDFWYWFIKIYLKENKYPLFF